MIIKADVSGLDVETAPLLAAPALVNSLQRRHVSAKKHILEYCMGDAGSQILGTLTFPHFPFLSLFLPFPSILSSIDRGESGDQSGDMSFKNSHAEKIRLFVNTLLQ